MSFRDPQLFTSENIKIIHDTFKNYENITNSQLKKLGLDQKRIPRILSQLKLTFLDNIIDKPVNSNLLMDKYAIFDYHNVTNHKVNEMCKLFQILKDNNIPIIILSYVPYKGNKYYEALMNCLCTKELSQYVDKVWLVFTKTELEYNKTKVLKKLEGTDAEIIFADDSWANCYFAKKYCTNVRVIHYTSALSQKDKDKQLKEHQESDVICEVVDNIEDLSNIYVTLFK